MFLSSGEWLGLSTDMEGAQKFGDVSVAASERPHVIEISGRLSNLVAPDDGAVEEAKIEFNWTGYMEGTHLVFKGMIAPDLRPLLNAFIMLWLRDISDTDVSKTSWVEEMFPEPVSVCQSKVSQVDADFSRINEALSMYFSEHAGKFPASMNPADVTRILETTEPKNVWLNPWGEPYLYVGNGQSYIFYTRINKGRGCKSSNQAWRFYSSTAGMVSFSREDPSMAHRGY